MIDYEINNDVECPYCFHSPLHNRGCTNLCDNGFFDAIEIDPINHNRRESIIPCQECKGTGTEWWCPQCGANLSDKLKECGFADDEKFTDSTEQPTMYDLYTRVVSFSQKTFADATLLDHVLKLDKEVKELKNKPTDVMEYADCLMCLFTSAYGANISYPDLIRAVSEKLAINEKRKWVKLEDGTYQHKG